MSSEERRKILQMVEEGRISAEDAAQLMRALDEDSVEDDIDPAEAEVEVIESRPGPGSKRAEGFESAAAPEFDEIKARARRFALIPLWIGVFITVFSAWIIYSIQQNAGVNFWFYCMVLPLLLGVLLIALGAGGRTSRWIYVDVDRRDAKPGDGPKHITLGFPIPLGFVAWFFETFGHNFSGLNKGRVEGIIQMMHATRDSNEPLMINVDDDDAHVQVYIG
jgi:SHOCT-like protein